MGRQIEGVLAGAAIAAGMAYAVRGRSSSLLAPSVYRGSRNRSTIALTFDDGPTPSTVSLLEILAKHNVPATFFQCGAQVRRYPQISREVKAAGHEIGNHTDTHPLLSLRTSSYIAGEIERAQEAIAVATGTAPRWFRAPYGVRWFGLRAVQREFGLTGVMWTTIGRDWVLDGDAVYRRLEANAQNGAIFCLHDGRVLAANPDIRSTLEAVRRIIPALQDRGFQFATVTELICPQI